MSKIKIRNWQFYSHKKPAWYEVFGFEIDEHGPSKTKEVITTIEEHKEKNNESIEIPKDATHIYIEADYNKGYYDSVEPNATITFRKHVIVENEKYDEQMEILKEAKIIYQEQLEIWDNLLIKHNEKEKDQEYQEFLILKKKYEKS